MSTDERRELIATDLRYLREHEVELWQLAYTSYQQQGRGALVVNFGQLIDGAIPMMYWGAVNGFPWPEAVEAAQSYDPETEVFIMMHGRLDDTGYGIMRWRRHRYQPLAT